MRNPIALPPLLITLLLALGSRPAAGDVTLFLGPPGGVGDVEIHDEEGILAVRTPAALQGIQLLPLDFVGRTSATELRPDRPRWRGDVPGAGRLVLPGGRGSLYRYRRDDAGGGASAFGVLLVDALGAAASLWEIPGTGPLGTVDPLLTKLAVAGDGSAFLAATTPAAGGDLFEVPVDGGAVVPRTGGLAPQAFRPHGLALLDAWGVGVSSHGVFRFARGGGGDARLVPFSAAIAADWIGGELVASDDESTVALIAGSSPTQACVVAVRAQGGIVPVGRTLAHLSGAGFLPEVQDGPHLALSTDGSFCMWRAEETLAREVYVARVGSTAADADEQVTADARFVDTLDHAGELLALGLHAFLVTVGERDDPVLGGVENGDVFRVDADPSSGAITVTNLSLTSGDTTLPFDAGGRVKDEIAPRVLPGAAWLLAYADTGSGAGDLLAVDPAAGGAQLLRGAIRDLELAEVVAGDLILGVRRRLGADVKELLRVPLVQPTNLTVLATLPATLAFTRPATSADGWLGTVVADVISEYVVRVQPAAPLIEVLPLPPLKYGPTIGFTPRGDLALSVGAPGTASLFAAWTKAGGANVFPTGPRAGLVLPGN